MAKSANEQIRDLSLEFRGVVERESVLRTNVADLKARDEKLQDENAELRKELVALRAELAATKQDTAVLKQQLLDHLAQYQEQDKRRWGLIMLWLGGVMSLVSGLIAALSRK